MTTSSHPTQPVATQPNWRVNLRQNIAQFARRLARSQTLTHDVAAIKDRASGYIIEDALGIRTVMYPWDPRPVDKVISRAFYADEFAATRTLINPGDMVLDVGANLGLHATLFSRLVGDAGCVHAFEPTPDTYWMLKETLALNRCDNVHTHRLAVSNDVGQTTFNLFDRVYHDYNSMGGATLPGYDGKPVKPQASVTVPTITLDAFCENNRIKRVNYLKVDVEGFEKWVFDGAQKMLSQGRVDRIAFEIAREPLKAAGMTASDVFDALASHGYQTYRFDAKAKSFETLTTTTDPYYENFFASRTNLNQSALRFAA